MHEKPLGANRPKMKTRTVIFGVLVLIAGIGVAFLYGLNIIDPTIHHPIRTAGGIGVAIVGGIITALGMTSKTATPASQFKCRTCGATFGSEDALSSHSKAKHGKS